MMMFNRALALATILAVLPLSRPVAAVDDDDVKDGINSEGYLSTWLVLAPISIPEGQDGAQAAAKEQIKEESGLKPKKDDKIEVDGKELTWKEAEAKEGVLDFNAVVGQETENSVAYAVTTIIVDEDKSDVMFKVGSDDQVRIFLNGKQIHANDEGRPHEKEEDVIAGLTLKKGRNILVMKVVNEPGDWEASVRVVDKDGAPIKGLTATTKPE
jgi:hypothetical protein